jgi:metallo-beta-lactamase family protein
LRRTSGVCILVAMPIRLKFLGAAENVTGSRYLLETGGTRLLIDCGLYQERDLNARNWEPFPVPPASINAVLLTHAHLDHCGYLPRLTRDGFRGAVYGTAATAEIAKIALLDSARIQEEDAAFKQKRHAREERKGPHPEIALYGPGDVETCCRHLEPVVCDRPLQVGEGVEAIFVGAGHILGATSILVRVRDGAAARTIVFSGDIGRWDRPILRDPVPCPPADYVVMESTYGDRVHEGTEAIADRLASAITATRQRGGNIIIPSFAIERLQDVLYYLNALLQADRIPHLMVFADSPMAVSVTEVFERHADEFDDEMRRLLRERQSPFHFPGLKMVRTPDESKAINHIQGTVVVIAGSGMCTGGRIKHHLVNNIARPESTVLFVGYQAVGTLGRLIVDGLKNVRILGQTYPVRAQIEQLHGFSAHADRNELLRWLAGGNGLAPRRVFVTHGEPEAAAQFAATIRKERNWATTVPKYGEEAVLD